MGCRTRDRPNLSNRRSSGRDDSPFNGLASGDRNIPFAVYQPWCGRRLTRGVSNMTEALSGKTCTPCHGEIPPLTREQAEVFHAQAPDWQLVEEAHRIEGASGFAIFERRLPLFRRLVNSRKLKDIIRISASVGAMRRSLCRPRRSRVCMRTTSSWPPRLTAYLLGRPRCERVLVVLHLCPLFGAVRVLRRRLGAGPEIGPTDRTGAAAAVTTVPSSHKRWTRWESRPR